MRDSGITINDENILPTEAPIVEAPEMTVGDSANIRELYKILEDENIELPSGIIKRLKLLDADRCCHGQCLTQGKENYPETDSDGNPILNAEGKPIYKHTETHLKHSLELKKVLENWLPYFVDEKSENYQEKRKMIIIAALLHDIGKTGPEITSDNKSDEDVNYAFASLFGIYESNRNASSTLSEQTIAYAIETHIPIEPVDYSDPKNPFTNRDRVLSGMKKAGFLPNKKHMKDIYGAHVDFSKEVLQEYTRRGEMAVKPEVLYLVANHHRWTHNFKHSDSADLVNALPQDEQYRKEIDKLATLMELADFFEAARARGETKDPITALNAMVTNYRKHEEDVPAFVFEMIKIIQANQ